MRPRILIWRKRDISIDQGSATPPQSGILTPGLRLRFTSMRPHLSSHSLPSSLKKIFQGSSKAENLISLLVTSRLFQRQGWHIPKVLSPVFQTRTHPVFLYTRLRDLHPHRGHGSQASQQEPLVAAQARRRRTPQERQPGLPGLLWPGSRPGTPLINGRLPKHNTTPDGTERDELQQLQFAIVDHWRTPMNEDGDIGCRFERGGRSRCLGLAELDWMDDLMT